MATIVTRAGKGSPLTHNEVDANFNNLNSDKVETSSVSAFGATLIDDADAATARTTLGLGTAATTASTDYATAAQGSLADSAVQPNDSPSFGSITVTGTVDGRDVAADGTKLDGIEAGADITDTANVTAAGALMDSELANITAVKALDQGVATTDSPSFAGLTVDTNTLYVDSTNNRVGIGTSSPSGLLDVKSTTGSSIVNVVSDANQAIVRITASPTSTSYLAIGDTDDIFNAGLAYPHSTNHLEIHANNAERIRIGSAGQLGISGANYGTSGQVLTSGGSGAAPSWQSGGSGKVESWVNFSGTTTSSISGSGNVSSITDNGVGIYTTNFSTALASSGYSIGACSGTSNVRIPAYQTRTTTSSRCEWTNHSVTFYDVGSCSMTYTL